MGKVKSFQLCQSSGGRCGGGGGTFAETNYYIKGTGRSEIPYFRSFVDS